MLQRCRRPTTSKDSPVTRTCGKTALCWGSEPPAHTVAYEEPLGPGDSGFSVLFEDAPDPDDLPPIGEPPAGLPPGLSLVCLACLIEDEPDIGRGMDIAREHGLAELDDDGEWQVGMETIPSDAHAEPRGS